MENCFTVSLSLGESNLEENNKMKERIGKKLRNNSNFAVIALSMDDYDSYHFWFTEC